MKRKKLRTVQMQSKEEKIRNSAQKKQSNNVRVSEGRIVRCAVFWQQSMSKLPEKNCPKQSDSGPNCVEIGEEQSRKNGTVQKGRHNPRQIEPQFAFLRF